jgi:hypothetical protein
MTLTDRIEIDPDVMLGKPVIRGSPPKLGLECRDASFQWGIALLLRRDLALLHEVPQESHSPSIREAPAVAEISPRAKDPIVLGLARSEARVLLTEDKDFGLLAYAGGHRTAGVLLIRFPTDARSGLREAVLSVVAESSVSSAARSSLYIPLDFEDTVRALLRTPPPPPETTGSRKAEKPKARKGMKRKAAKKR